jgi:hypothetical protein
MKRKVSIVLVMTLMVTLLTGLNVTAASAAGSSQTFYLGDPKFGATITFPTFLGTTEVTVSAKYNSSETVKKTYPVVAYPGDGAPWYNINDVKGTLKNADWLSEKGSFADCFGISFQVSYWNRSNFFGDSGSEMLSGFYTQEQISDLSKAAAFISYPGQFGGDTLKVDAQGVATGSARAGMSGDPYIHMFNMDIGSAITTTSGASLGNSVLVIPASTVSNYMITAATGGAPVSAKASAIKNMSAVRVNGAVTAFDAYTIGGNNYFKLRDIAKVISGSSKQFDVTWDGSKNAINLLSGKTYTVVGGEMAASTGSAQVTALLNTATIYLDGAVIALTAYTINSSNYFKLRDLGRTLNFGVDWDGETSSICIDTSKGYSE